MLSKEEKKKRQIVSTTKWKKDNPEKLKIQWKKYREKHKDEIKAYYQKNKKRLNKRRSELWRLKHPIAPHRRYKLTNVERKEYKTRYEKHRRLKLRFYIFQRDKFTCQYCGRKSPDVILQIDHIHPKSKGGKYNKDNLITACLECNLGKRDTILEEFN